MFLLLYKQRFIIKLVLLSKQRFSFSGVPNIRAVEAFVGITETIPTNMPISAVGNGAKCVWIIVPGLAYW